jgi:hypothetical protein
LTVFKCPHFAKPQNRCAAIPSGSRRNARSASRTAVRRPFGTEYNYPLGKILKKIFALRIFLELRQAERALAVRLKGGKIKYRITQICIRQETKYDHNEVFELVHAALRRVVEPVTEGIVGAAL